MPSSLSGRRIVLGVSGGIAAFKAAELVSRLVSVGVGLRVVMTEAATRFVTPLTFHSLSGNPVAVDTFDRSLPVHNHVESAAWGELLVVAPATADILGKAAAGIADDCLSTALLSFSGPVLFAPAMNWRMWGHPAVRANVAVLVRRGASLVGPKRGRLACGENGEGRMAEVSEIVEVIKSILSKTGRGARGRRRRGS
jgi:phosphopantothenoylcysteine decarboxylase/phosphopantothenate--cysteine ligase